MTQIKTFTADYKFITKELDTVWCIECDAQKPQLPFRNENGVLYIKFTKNTSKETADEIRDLLRKNVQNFTFLG